jgi:hypothetical protein
MRDFNTFLKKHGFNLLDEESPEVVNRESAELRIARLERELNIKQPEDGFDPEGERNENI